MTDSEMMEFAAKAAGITLHWDNEGTAWLKWPSFKWAPRDNDGDAFRLLVTLGTHMGETLVLLNCKAGDDPLAAARLAILRAAAEVGMAIP